MSKITASARGQECQVRYPGICNGNPETTVWAHANGYAAGKGKGLKGADILGAYCCSACHDAYDGRTRAKYHPVELERMFWEGHARSVVMLLKAGLIKEA